jgi:hypothetical protein
VLAGAALAVAGAGAALAVAGAGAALAVAGAGAGLAVAGAGLAVESWAATGTPVSATAMSAMLAPSVVLRMRSSV